ncbi:hypothetical protein Bbelb_047840 [Branchiostoma belcheri]|nr:hypothetical protein Bbelb_407130 [Branchiostoma belcheri]KAI8516203.1 hypothetical protein Bbelb_047840 [Branchiostoma belcheri]
METEMETVLTYREGVVLMTRLKTRAVEDRKLRVARSSVPLVLLRSAAMVTPTLRPVRGYWSEDGAETEKTRRRTATSAAGSGSSPRGAAGQLRVGLRQGQANPPAPQPQAPQDKFLLKNQTP